MSVHQFKWSLNNRLNLNISVDTSLYWRTRACAAGLHCTGRGRGGHLTQVTFCCWDNEAIETIFHCLISVLNVFNRCLFSVFVPLFVWLCFLSFFFSFLFVIFYSRTQTNQTFLIFTWTSLLTNNISLQQRQQMQVFKVKHRLTLFAVTIHLLFTYSFVLTDCLLCFIVKHLSNQTYETHSI